MVQEMLYNNNEQFSKAIAHMTNLTYGFYEGYEVVVKNRGNHMCAYINLPKDHPLTMIFDGNFKHREEDIDSYIFCHGGVTFAEKVLIYDGEVHPGYWFGWDYAHYGDYNPIEWRGIDLTPPSEKDAHKWTVEEVIMECGYVISQLDKIDEIHLEQDVI